MSSERSVDWEKDIYAKGQQVNTWPYTDVVSTIMSGFPSAESRQNARFLEIGCGTGNNLWFAGRSGFAVAGMDVSPTAIEFTKKRLASEGITQADLRVGSLVSLPWEDEQFDLVVDRAAVTHNTYADIRSGLREVHRVMKPNAFLHSFTLFGLSNPDRKLGTEVAPNTFDGFSGGFFSKVGLTSFFEFHEIEQLFSVFRDVQIVKRVKEDRSGRVLLETFDVSCRK